DRGHGRHGCSLLQRRRRHRRRQGRGGRSGLGRAQSPGSDHRRDRSPRDAGLCRRAHPCPAAERRRARSLLRRFGGGGLRRNDDLLYEVFRAAAAHGGMLQVHCENATIIDALVAGALAAGNVAARYHAETRPAYAEAEATHRAIALARAAQAPVYIVHLSSADALAEVVAAKARGWPVYAETCPHYLALTAARYASPDEGEVIRSVISPPLRTDADRRALWLGLRAGGLDLVASDHVPDRLAVEKRMPAPPFPEISNGAPGIETLLTMVHGTGVARGEISLERLVDVLAPTPARLFGLPGQGA